MHDTQVFQESEATLRTLINSSVGDYMAFWNASNELNYANFSPSEELVSTAKSILESQEPLRFEKMQNEKWFDYNFNPVFSANGTFQGVVLFARDMTDRKIAEDELREQEWREQEWREQEWREQEWRYRSVTDSARDAIIAMNSHGDIISWNNGANLIFGYSEKEMLGKSLNILIPKKFKKSHVVGLKRICKTGKEKLIGKTVELTALRKDGSEFPIELTLGSWEGHNKIFFSGIIRDIAERKENEGQLRQVQKMAALGNLAGGIAHDLNNMLLPILALTAMTVKKLPEDSAEREMLNKVVQAAKKSRDLVKRILAFSHYDEDTKKENIDLYATVKDAMGLLHATLPTTIKVKEKLNKNVGKIFADSAQIQTVLLNLAANSADAMQGHPGKVEVILKRTRITEEMIGNRHELAPGIWIELSVRDTGCGMDKTTLRQIFDPFFTTKGVGEGTGLGLSMVHGIITSHCGFLDVDSSYSKGTIFHIFLPLVQNKPRPAINLRR